MRSSPWLLCWLLAGPCLSVPGVPIYCRRFKGNCRRSKSTCCLFLDKTTPAPTTSTSTTTTENLEEYVDELEFSNGGDPLDAQPSYVEEVFVKPTLEELNLVTEPEDPPVLSSDRSSQSSPGFCSIFKIRCSTRPGHQCCRNKAEESSSQRNGLLEQTVRPTTEQEQKAEHSQEIHNSSQDADLTKEKQKSKFSKSVKSKSTGRSKGRNLFNRKSKPTKEPKSFTSTTISTTIIPPVKKKQSNSFKNKLKSSLFGSRPRSFDPRKSALCRIVNCGRSPHHKCCKQEEEEQPQVTTTTEAAVTEITQELTTFEITTLIDGYVEEDVAKTDIILTVEEARKNEVTMEYASKKEDSIKSLINFLANSTTINSMVEEENVPATSVPLLEFITLTVEAEADESVDKGVENGSGNDVYEEGWVEREEEGSASEVSKNKDSGEDKLITKFLDGSGGEETTVVTMEIMHDEQRTDSLDILQGGHEINDQDQIHAEEKMYYEDDIHAKEEIPTKEESTTTSSETLESFLATSSTSPVPEVTQRMIAPVYVPAWRKRQEEKEEEEIERRKEETRMRQEADIKSQRAIIEPSNAQSIKYKEIDNSLDLNGLGDSDTVEEDQDNSLDDEDDWSSDWTDCREFDCLVSPSHLCCSPHATEKRQTGAKGWQGGGPRVTVLSLTGFNSLVAPLVLDYPGRVTATVTRVEKSYSWSPWKKIGIIDNYL